MTLSEIARRIEAARPGTLPPRLWPGTPSELWTWCAHDRAIEISLHDDLARFTLIGAMVMATDAIRGDGVWYVDAPVGRLLHESQEVVCETDTIEFADSDHGNDPLLSLLAAFEAVHAKEAT